MLKLRRLIKVKEINYKSSSKKFWKELEVGDVIEVSFSIGSLCRDYVNEYTITNITSGLKDKAKEGYLQQQLYNIVSEVMDE